MRNNILLVSFLLSVQISNGWAQIIDLDFNGNTANAANALNGAFLVFEDEGGDSLINYTSGISDQAIHLDSSMGFRFPLEVTDSIFSSNIVVYKLTFMITDWGSGDGDRVLISHKRSGTNTGPYYHIRANKSTDSTARLSLNMNDRANFNINKGLFYIDLNEWVNLTFTLNLDEEYYEISSSTYYSKVNLEDFDTQSFITNSAGSGNSLQHNQVHLGYHQGLSSNHLSPNENYNNDYSGDLIVDDFKIYNQLPESDEAVFQTALEKLTDHLTGTHLLTDEEITAYTSDALLNFKDNYLSSKAIIDAYFMAYESVYDPLFSHDNNVDFYSYYDEFGWIQLNLQLDVFDNYYTAENLNQLEGLIFATHQNFPGPVSDSASRLDNQIISINGTYLADPGYNLKILDPDYGAYARRGTGCYVAPGELVRLVVPEELINIGAQVGVGVHTHDVSGKLTSGIRRFPRLVQEFPIDDDTVFVTNPLGGGLYIYIPEGTDLGQVDLEVSGAVKFPYYAKNSINVTDIADFEGLVATEHVLWAEVETDNFMYTAPIAFFKRDDIVETVDTWDDMWEAYQLYNGRPAPLHKAEHLVIDKMSKWNTLAGGYPMVLTWGTAPFITDFWVDVAGVNMMNILDYENAIKDDKATYWHEMSHHTSLPTVPWEIECIVEVAYVVTNHVGLGMPLDSAMKYSERGYQTRDEAIISWVIKDNFVQNLEMEKIQRQYQQRGYSKYIDLGVLFGWDSLGLVNKVFYDEWTAMGGQVNDPDENIITNDELILAACRGLNVNAAPLFHFWGHIPNDTIMDDVMGYPRSKEIYERLIGIRNFIPDSQEEFEPYYNSLAPTSSSSQDYDEFQDAYNNWEAQYDSIIAQIDSLIEWYYGSDFDEDGYHFLDDCNDCDAGYHPDTKWFQDLDNDGYGDINAILVQCDQPTGYVLDSTDCNDTLSTINPAATETLNDLDDNCDGVIDEGLITGLQHAYQDQLSVYPNPTTGELNWRQAQNYILINSDGRKMESGFSYKCDLTDYPQGLYLLILEESGTFKVQKIE